VGEGLLTLFLCGDVMLGRGVDQILPAPGNPELQETYVTDARYYVELAERVNGPIPFPVDFEWVWGDALQVLDEAAPDVRVVNLETSITGSGDFAPGKGVHYRMSPDNLPVLVAGRPDVCVLANNHVLDFGRTGLAETLGALAGARLPAVGAGPTRFEAQRPAIARAGGGRRVMVFSFGMPSSGIPASWVATEHRSGVDFVPEPSDRWAAEVVARVRQLRRPGSVVVASIHWGSNWGYDVSRREIGFAHQLIDGGVDVVHGHSSHHPRPIEVYRGKLILYGCGDFIDDYEGIRGYDEYRDDLRLLYFVSIEADTGRLVCLRMAAMQARRMRLTHASSADAEWLQSTLNRISARFGQGVDRAPDGTLLLRAA
jgi:poly-gamma-glutamate capsule biosynthesis protein CapA/YwtB (metallophosphatase superfamily)